MSLNLHVEHRADTLSRMTGGPSLACDGIVLRLGSPDEVFACRLDANPLREDPAREPWAFDPSLPGDVILSWSGSLGDHLFTPHPATWLRPGQEAFAAFCDQVRPAFEREGRTLCIHPHARHALSDVQGCVAFLRAREGQPFGVALAPASMLTMSMLDTVEDHLTRAFETLGLLATMVILEDVRPAPTERDEDALEHVSLGEGVLPAATIRRLLDAHVPETTPVVIRAGALDRQRQWLEAGDQCAPRNRLAQ